MEDENQVSEATKKAACETARGYFNLLHDHNQLPSIWGNLSLDLKNEYLYLVESTHPFLCLCENHWKADMIGTNSYSQWPKPGGTNDQNSSAEKVDDTKAAGVNAGNSDNHNKPQKRPQAEDGKRKRLKRPRAEEVRSTPQPMKITSGPTSDRDRTVL